jgi:AcrR family transcriptional regulator
MTSATSQLAPSRRERRRREIHERILEAAVGLFQRKGFTSTTALEIADHADVAEKTFYNHFPTKQNLIEELAERSLATTTALLVEAREAPGTTADRLRRFCERAADVAELTRVAQVDGVGPEHHRQLHMAIQKILEEGLERGDIQPGRDVDFISELGVAAYLGIIINWVTLQDYPLRERLMQLADVGAELLESRLTHRSAKGDR